ncbi:LysR family transcriptional regulator [Oceanospirillum linum]|uniref:HTH lysR-type domain-containing protein n=1 Tax=Oceanospirillum linum TaxID=966 RepID=A0A1T1HA28_OCELI|nr:LysR family transcriptional regulator [Oceanospirillum linum]OOV86708.1 hypothetical protein BTA35_0212635 [Oceanospirillum linum]SEG25518.1 DNA-binding transcriptional regulator, LysR family [Oleiphilus messinensis]SMP27918.1 transcriptional regulator, LysR family [Oceanospirillum linum]
MKSILNLELLNTFSIVVQEGGFKGAAEKLFLSQGAVSMQVKRLEEQLGVCLMQRNNQGIKLTSHGSALLKYAEQFLQLNNEALNALSEAPLYGELHFGVPTDYAQELVKYFIPQIKRSFPELNIRVTCARSRHLRDKIRLGDLDMAIVTAEAEFDEETLWTERLLWAAPTDLIQKEQKPLPIAFFEGDCLLNELFLADLNALDREYTTVMTSPELANLVAAVTSGFAAALLPESSLSGHDLQNIQPVAGLPQNRVLSMNLIHAPQLNHQFLEPLRQCIRSAVKLMLSRT